MRKNIFFLFFKKERNDMNYEIFRNESIMTINDLGQIDHTKNEKKAYKRNKNIKLE